MKIKLAILSSLLILNLSNAQKLSDHFNDKNTAISISDRYISYRFSLETINPKWEKGLTLEVSVSGVGQEAIKSINIGNIETIGVLGLSRLDFKSIPSRDCEKILTYLRRIKKWFAFAKREFGPNIDLIKSASPPALGVPFSRFS